MADLLMMIRDEIAGDDPVLVAEDATTYGHDATSLLHLAYEALTAERAKVEEATKALWVARKELENYVKDDMGYSNSSVVYCIEEVDAALEKLRGQ